MRKADYRETFDISGSGSITNDRPVKKDTQLLIRDPILNTWLLVREIFAN